MAVYFLFFYIIRGNLGMKLFNLGRRRISFFNHHLRYIIFLRLFLSQMIAIEMNNESEY